MSIKYRHLIDIPHGALSILNRLLEGGYGAYVVGGCVRDSLLGIEPHDWDIVTSAPIDNIKLIFKRFRTIETGIKHGTLTIVINDVQYEVSTYKGDSIKEDVKHRDFTINAMAYNYVVGLLDFFNGYDDLQNGVIRCVENPDERFKEDGLRILRALRFSSQFGFYPDEKTIKAMYRNAYLLNNIAVERIQSELCKIITGKYAEHVLLYDTLIFAEVIPELKPCIGFEQNSPYHNYTVYEHMVRSVLACKADDLTVKLALFFHDIGKPAVHTVVDGKSHFYEHPEISKEVTRDILDRLRFDNATKRDVLELIRYHDININPNDTFARRWLNRIGEAQFKRLLDVREADALAHSELKRSEHLQKINKMRMIVDDVLKQNQCFKVSDLAINGYDIMSLGIEQGKIIGEIQNRLIDLVIEGRIANNRATLLYEAMKIKEEI